MRPGVDEFLKPIVGPTQRSPNLQILKIRDPKKVFARAAASHSLMGLPVMPHKILL